MCTLKFCRPEIIILPDRLHYDPPIFVWALRTHRKTGYLVPVSTCAGLYVYAHARESRATKRPSPRDNLGEKRPSGPCSGAVLRCFFALSEDMRHVRNGDIRLHNKRNDHPYCSYSFQDTPLEIGVCSCLTSKLRRRSSIACINSINRASICFKSLIFIILRTAFCPYRFAI